MLADQIFVFPAGIYAIDDTITIPPGSRIVGVLWPQLMAVGSKFDNVNDPHVFIRVGEAGQTGLVEISDVIITGKGPLRGAIYMEWNMKELEGQQGSAAMWEVLFRIGGALGMKSLHVDISNVDVGTDLQLSQCPSDKVGNIK